MDKIDVHDQNGKFLFTKNILNLFDLDQKEGFFYEKSSDVPFTGEVYGSQTGRLEQGIREGYWKNFYSDGSLSSEYTFEEGDLNGVYVGYWKNGELHSKGSYKNDKKEGRWTYHHQKNGEVKLLINFREGQYHGSWKHYHESGNLLEQGHYKNGKKDGRWEYYELDSKEVKVETYKNGVKQE